MIIKIRMHMMFQKANNNRDGAAAKSLKKGKEKGKGKRGAKKFANANAKE